jgi:putative transposase
MNKIDLRQLGIIQNWPDDMSDTEVEECVNHFLTTTPGAIDPGVGKPLSLYDAERLISFEYKKNIYNKLITKLHLLQSLRDKKMVKNRSHKKARYRIRKRWINLVNDMHYKCASYLVSNYKVIGLPPFKTSEMVTSSKLNKKTKLEMLNWGHFKFKTRLESKARQLSRVLKIDESYTTQTCTNCGTLKYMGSNKIYECLNCKHKIGRDDGSARSIFMCMMHMRCV